MRSPLSSTLRTRALLCAVAATLTASAATATTLHRNAISQATGSEGASTTLQTTATSSAFQGEVGSKANTTIKIPFGVLGEYDASTSTFGIGVAGISTSGYGVAAESFGNNPSMLAESSSGNDALDAVVPSGGDGVALLASTDGGDFSIIAKANNGIAVYATSSEQNAVEGASETGTGVAGFSTSGSGLTGTATGSTAGGSNSDLFQVGVTATAQVGIGALVTNNSAYEPAIQINNTANTGGLIEAGIDGNYLKFDVDGSGDVYAAGTITSAGTMSAVSRNPGSAMLTYAPQQAEASMEDVGSARLVNGSAIVPLAADFKQTIDTNVPYAVFLTPYGDNHGLFIASRTSSGFVVREAQNGRSSLSFDYRIVAKPYGTQIARLPHAGRPKNMYTRASAESQLRSKGEFAAVSARAAAVVARARKNAESLRVVRR